MTARRCPTCGQPVDLEARVRAWAADVRALAQQLDAQAAAREAPYRTARYRRWRWPVAVTGVALMAGACFMPSSPWWGALVAVTGMWNLAAVHWLLSGTVARQGD